MMAGVKKKGKNYFILQNSRARAGELNGCQVFKFNIRLSGQVSSSVSKISKASVFRRPK